MPENTAEQLIPPSQEILNGIWDKVAALTEGVGFQPKDDKHREITTLDGTDGHRFNFVVYNEIREELDPSKPLITIIIHNLRAKREEPLYYSLYKDKSSGEKRLERHVPPPKRKMLSGDEPREEVFAKARRLKEELMGRMEDVNIRRFRGLSRVSETEAQKLFQLLNTIKTKS